MNEECYLIIDNKLKDKNKQPVECDPTVFFDWIDNATKFNNSIATLASRQTRSEHSFTFNPKLSCYYCGKTGHHKLKTKEPGFVHITL